MRCKERGTSHCDQRVSMASANRERRRHDSSPASTARARPDHRPDVPLVGSRREDESSSASLPFPGNPYAWSGRGRRVDDLAGPANLNVVPRGSLDGRPCEVTPGRSRSRRGWRRRRGRRRYSRSSRSGPVSRQEERDCHTRGHSDDEEDSCRQRATARERASLSSYFCCACRTHVWYFGLHLRVLEDQPLSE